ncbi:hypothetical protein QNH47_10290 [Virgibacillus halodenitrificans]|uniref:hypothetical protein n=1 Tax=Virgibacillus halodenitrificans TaxID=1482 RepID=UPI0024C02C01|nr:hypothetical protein [Virgibacillus halodenitrificans]WHX24584.1 hypothetical protein QNH47_10290 [Virgibacillus halodenitrificans]
MKKAEENRRQWGNFTAFTLIVGLIVGTFSVVSDNLPIGALTVSELILSYLAVTINSLPLWFIFAMLVGYLFASSVKKAALFGFIYTIIAITFYFLIGNFYTDIPISVPFKERIGTYAIWYGASAVGGVSGGIVGFLTKKKPYALLILMAGLILQLFVSGSSSWSNVVGIAQNITFCLIIMGIIIRLTVLKDKRRLRNK